MVKILRIIISIFISLSCYAQQNLVPNPGFEDIVDPNKCGDGPEEAGYSGLLAYWNNVDHWTVPGRKSLLNICANLIGTSDLVCNQPVRRGDFATRGGGREYITVQLSNNMITGQWYYYEFYIYTPTSGSVQLNKYGLHLSTEKVKQCGTQVISENPQMHFPFGSFLAPQTWTKVSGYYQADDDYEWLLVGNFDEDYEDNSPKISFIYWDDFLIYDLGPSVCPPNRLIENSVYTIDGFTLEAANDIRAGRDVGSPVPNGIVRVMPDADITYKADNCISLEDGFEVLLGGSFEAFNAPCNLDCPADNFSFNISTGVTGETPDAIGTVDNQWKYVLNETGSAPASDNLGSASGPWGASSTQANWINPDGDGNKHYSPGIYTFEVTFNIGFTLMRFPQIIINEVAVDNSARVYLNNLPVLGLGHELIFGNLEPAPWPGSGFISHDNLNQVHGPFVIDHPIYFNNGVNRLKIEVYSSSSLMALLMNARFHYMECTAGTGRYADTLGGRDTSISDVEIAALHQYRKELEKQPNHRLIETDHLTRIQVADTSFYDKMNDDKNTSIAQLEIKTLKILPNPNNGKFTILLPDDYVEKLSITDMMGKIIFTTSTTQSAMDIDLSSQAKGMYFVKVQTGEQVLVEKVILQ